MTAGLGQSLSFYSNNRIIGLSYDSAGNVTNDNVHSYAFDAENKIVKLDNVAAYVYDGGGKRVRKLVGENTRFVYGIGGELLAEYDGSNNSIKKEYVYGASGLTATIEPTTGTQYATTDHLGSPRIVTNASGTVVARRDFMPFGEEIGSTIGGRSSTQGWGASNTIRQQFTGYEKDTESGLDFAQARYYGGAHGRFTSPDPLMASARIANPQTFNRYSYVTNNPLNLVDPLGLEGCDAKSKKDCVADRVRPGTQAQAEANPIAVVIVNGSSSSSIFLGATGTVSNAITTRAPIPIPNIALPLSLIPVAEAVDAAARSENPGYMNPTEAGIAMADAVEDAIIGTMSPAVPTDEDVAPPPNGPNGVTLFRGLNATNPGAFRVDADGVSVFEFPSPTHKMNLPIQAIYYGPKIEGTIGTLVDPALSGGQAVYTPSLGGPGHWSLRFPNYSEQQIKQTLSNFAKSILK